MIIDAHHHYWRAGHTQHDWRAPRTRALHRDYLAADLEPSLDAAGVDATVVVQSANRLADTRGLLDIAANTPSVAGVVGWVPLEGAERTTAALDAFTGERLLVGLRHLINTEPDPDWVVQEPVLEGLQVLADRGLTFDAVPVTSRQLENVCTVAERVPELRLVLDHLGKPPLLEGGFEPWGSLLARLAEHPNVAAKVSAGLDVVVAWERWNLAEFQPYLDHAIACFGPERLIAASNWPVVLLAGEYVDVWAQTRAGLAQLTPGEQASVLGETATRWYGLQGTGSLLGRGC